MRTLDDHKVNPANDLLLLEVLDEPGSGNAHHHYRMSLPDGSYTDIRFQNGPINEAGLNGLTHEALLSILADRLRSFQEGPYACEANGLALNHILSAADALASRTRARMARGVEGTHTV